MNWVYPTVTDNVWTEGHYVIKLYTHQQIKRERKKSLMQVRNDNGASTDPCGTPALLCNAFEAQPFIATYCCLAFISLFNHCSVCETDNMSISTENCTHSVTILT